MTEIEFRLFATILYIMYTCTVYVFIHGTWTRNKKHGKDYPSF